MDPEKATHAQLKQAAAFDACHHRKTNETTLYITCTLYCLMFARQTVAMRAAGRHVSTRASRSVSCFPLHRLPPAVASAPFSMGRLFLSYVSDETGVHYQCKQWSGGGEDALGGGKWRDFLCGSAREEEAQEREIGDQPHSEHANARMELEKSVGIATALDPGAGDIGVLALHAWSSLSLC